MLNNTLIFRLCSTAIFAILLFSLNPAIVGAQVFDCPTPAPDPNKPEESDNANCFDPLDFHKIYDECKPVYININVHMFVEDDCCGETRIVNSGQAESYRKIEQFINECNERLINNQEQWHSGLPPACVPIRYVLKGVYLHCKSDIDYFDYENASYYENANTEINVFFQPVGPYSGIADIYAPYTVGMANTAHGTFNHEFGHVFGLWHAHEYNDLAGAPCADDTDPHRVNWDANGNGVLQDYNVVVNGVSKIVRENNYFCWTYIGDWPLGYGQEADKNYNGIHDCDESAEPGAPTDNSPCCDWGNLNNNVMAYNNYNTAFTACQSLTMLNKIQTTPALCAYVNSVDPQCPPPSAFISQTPIEKNGRYCTETLILGASFNETQYRLKIVRTSNNQSVYSSGWMIGQVENVKVSIVNTCTDCIILQPGVQYTAILTVENDCGEESEYEYTFTTKESCERIELAPCPDGEIDPDPNDDPAGRPLGLAIAPNPSFGNVNIQFDAALGEMFQIEVLNLTTNKQLEASRQYTAVEGVNQLRLELQGQQPGYYQVTVKSSKQFYVGKFLKVN
ncbi:MAG: hypothetical protein J0L99_13390 [Chitinophagales bacterium]|nr:hypothetical protein [Chitinophagales bacterium]